MHTYGCVSTCIYVCCTYSMTDMCKCVYMCGIFMCICICVHAHCAFCIFVHMQVCLCVCVYASVNCAYVHRHMFLCIHICVLIHICMNDCACYVWINVCVQCCMYMCVFWNILDCQYTADIIILYKGNQLWLQTSHIILSERCLTQYLAWWIIPSNISGICSSKRK